MMVAIAVSFFFEILSVGANVAPTATPTVNLALVFASAGNMKLG